MWWEFHHLLIILDIIILLAIFVHSLVPVLFSTGIPTMELWRVNSKLLATLLLWSEWAIVHSKSFANWITILTLVVQPNPYFGRTFQPMFNCVCFPRAYFLISFDLTMLSPCSPNGGNPSFGNIGELPLSSPDTSLSSPWFNGELLLQKPAPIVHFPRSLQCHFNDLCCAFSSRTSWVSGILTPIGSESRSDMMVGTIPPPPRLEDLSL